MKWRYISAFFIRIGDIMQVTFEQFIQLVKKYNSDEVGIIRKAYEFAEKHHEGQIRESGEPYIVHPLAVAWILANMHADRDTVCAGLLHDVIEDCNVSKKEIEQNFNEKIAELVDGVTNLTQVDFKSKTERDYATKRKIILGINKDARIVIIKLADRLHNILTLQYKSPEKRIMKANETMQFYAPLARYIGAESLRRELEDLSFSYLHPHEYYETKLKTNDYLRKTRIDTNQMMIEIYHMLSDENVPHYLKLRIKNIYSIYQRINMGETIDNLHDFLAIKILVSDVKECYNVLRIIHSLYEPLNKSFKDYICKPKPNMYSSLHTSVFGPEGILVQVQIRTHEMEKINLQGLTAYWDICQGKAGDTMQEILKNKYKFGKSLKAISRIFQDNQSFVQRFQQDVIGEKIFIYGSDGRMIELQDGSTVIDYAYNCGEKIGNSMFRAYVNGQLVEFNTTLSTGDRVQIITSEHAMGPEPGWLNDATTIKAQKAIRKSLMRERKNEIY